MTTKNRPFVYDASSSKACCERIELVLRDGVIRDVTFTGGCEGNHRGLVALVRGRKAKEVIDLLMGTPCGKKGTSCPDQLAKALQAAIKSA